jgi:ClpP class serine protease
VRAIANGLTYGGEEAVEMGLVDVVGTYEDALDEAALAGGLDPSSYDVTYLGQDYGFSLLQLLLGAEARQAFRGLGEEVAAGLRAGLEAGEGPSLR